MKAILEFFFEPPLTCARCFLSTWRNKFDENDKCYYLRRECNVLEKILNVGETDKSIDVQCPLKFEEK